ncbi:MAG: hypothetical protein ABEI06_10075 [Halobacteriaceae archaeon]
MEITSLREFLQSFKWYHHIIAFLVAILFMSPFFKSISGDLSHFLMNAGFILVYSYALVAVFVYGSRRELFQSFKWYHHAMVLGLILIRLLLPSVASIGRPAIVGTYDALLLFTVLVVVPYLIIGISLLGYRRLQRHLSDSEEVTDTSERTQI